MKNGRRPSTMRPVTFEDVAEVVRTRFRIRLAQLQGTVRTRALTIPRHMAWWLSYQLVPGASLTEIGRRYGRDHSTVLAGIRKVERDKDQAGTLELLAVMQCEIEGRARD